MSPSEALNYVLELYEIKTQELADKSDVHKSIISKFRNGRSDISAKNLQKIVKALPPEARTHFNMLFSFAEADRVAEKSNKHAV